MELEKNIELHKQAFKTFNLLFKIFKDQKKHVYNLHYLKTNNIDYTDIRPNKVITPSKPYTYFNQILS